MEENDVLNILKLYRHDIMNQMQLVQGYLSMGATEKVAEKVHDITAAFHEERKLMALEAPKFALWLIQFNSLYDNIRITYEIHIENKNGKIADALLLQQCKNIIKYCYTYLNPMKLYEMKLNIREVADHPNQLLVEMIVDPGITEDLRLLNEYAVQNNKIEMKETEHGTAFTLIIPCHIPR